MIATISVSGAARILRTGPWDSLLRLWVNDREVRSPLAAMTPGQAVVLAEQQCRRVPGKTPQVTQSTLLTPVAVGYSLGRCGSPIRSSRGRQHREIARLQTSSGRTGSCPEKPNNCGRSGLSTLRSLDAQPLSASRSAQRITRLRKRQSIPKG